MRCKLLLRTLGRTQMTTMVGLLGLGGALWLTTETFSPQIAWAEAARVNLSLDRMPNETFESLVQRAKAAATTAVQTSFQQNNEITNVAVTVVAQNKGAIAPILSLQVNRQEWHSSSTLQPWTTYYPNAKALLQFDNVATTSPTPSGSAYTRTNPNRFFNGSGQPRNTFPSSGRGRVFGTPVEPIINSPLTPTQPTIQPGIVNSAPPPSTTPAPGSGMTPTPPTPVPVISPNNPQEPLTPTNSTPGVTTPLPQLPSNGTTSNTTSGTNNGTTSNTAPGT
ncbi:MAG: hypothetical protein JOZ78_16195 [Chroococcidiopsidaceae cyanobacterium CP_BM_ER_R8_30]|nr:hypothetical protein [Chroococcidiopsidaceae cyanobacterium CP_BM_ER_R8_30]